MKKYLYYPGCSMDSSARAYGVSINAILDPLGIELHEVDDWNCCGATEYMSISQIPAYSLITRNLAIASNQSNGASSIVAPCSACYLNLSKADYKLSVDDDLANSVNFALDAGDLKYVPGTIEIRHLLDILINDIGLDHVKEKVVNPLKGIRVAPYLGCLLTRPDYHKRFSDPDYPVELDNLISALGAEVIDFPMKTHCCGGHMPQISPDTAYELIRRLIDGADQYNADVIVTLCPMCQLNLDAYQGEMNKHFSTSYQIPVIFFTQLIGLAFGIKSKELGFGAEFVDVGPALAKVGDEPETIGKKKPIRKRTGLPMPNMLGQEEE